MGKFARKACALIISAALLAPVGARAQEKCNDLIKKYEPQVEQIMGKWNPSICGKVKIKIRRSGPSLSFSTNEKKIYINAEAVRGGVKEKADMIDHELGHYISAEIGKTEKGKKLLKEIKEMLKKDKRTIITRNWIKLAYYYSNLMKHFEEKVDGMDVKEREEKILEKCRKELDFLLSDKNNIRNKNKKEIRKILRKAKKIIYKVGKIVGKIAKRNNEELSIENIKRDYLENIEGEELFAMAVDSLMDGYTGRGMLIKFELSKEVLKLFKQIKFEGEWIFGEAVEAYEKGEKIPVKKFDLKGMECEESTRTMSFEDWMNPKWADF
ncbi:hypothetical protein KAW38_04040 [Candidatus Micrarchaeota archaeon]|nr:hypothetical protein [Candidatus Micrarchaeota archaeon]